MRKGLETRHDRVKRVLCSLCGEHIVFWAVSDLLFYDIYFLIECTVYVLVNTQLVS